MTELFWQGDFGDAYLARNQSRETKAASFRLLVSALATVGHLDSVLELGANVGNNLEALELLYPDIRRTAVEVNARACERLRELGVDTHHASLVELDLRQRFDLVLSCGVLIHVAPEQLPAAYQALHLHSSRWVLIAEYYSPRPQEVSYRGHSGVMWKRDFAGELMDTYSDLKLRDVGVTYRRQSPGNDDLMWFLLERVR